MEENSYCVYGHKNKINGKWYIGQTVYGDNPERRWGKDGRRYDRNPKFANGIQKYGWDNFEHIILKENLTKEEADYWEKYYIEYYNAKENGYNLTEGGEGNVGYAHSEETKRKISEAQKGKHPSEEAKEKMSEAQKGEKNHNYGKHHTEETRKKISEAMKGENNPNYGKHISEETKRKMSEALKGEKHPFYGKHLTEETKRKMSETRKGKNAGEKHPFYGKHLAEETRKKISEAFKGEKHPNYGKHHTKETKQRISEALKGKQIGEKNPKAKKVICVETNEIFSCGKECAEKMNISYSSLRSCCQGRTKTACGYHFKYYED